MRSRILLFLLIIVLLTEVLAAPATKKTSTTKKAATKKASATKKTSTSSKKTSTTAKTSSKTSSKTTTKTTTLTTSKSTTTIISSTKSTTTPSSTKSTTTPLTTVAPTATPSTTVASTTTVSTTTVSTTTSTATSSPTFAFVKSAGKRGLGFNDPALTDYFSLSGQGSKVSWAYNWASDPYYPSGYTPNSFHPDLTYTPMLWSGASSLTSIWNTNVANAIATHGTDALLSFNEPDGCCWSCGNSCMNVTEAVQNYTQWMQPYAGQVLLGSPAVTNGVGDGVGISYMEYFMGNCTGCHVDFIPLHFYGSVLDPTAFTDYVQSFWTTFGLPIWITEFGTTSGTEDQIVAFLQAVLPWLDQQSYVQRYAYFMDTNSGSPYLLESNNSMTNIGVVFNSS